MSNLITSAGLLDFTSLLLLQEKPALFAPGEPLFWDDPHISSQMLKAHLDPENDIASRRPETIRKSVEWITETLQLAPGKAVVDLGCGPGLYAERLAENGLRVTGVDYSRRSIAYATEQSAAKGLGINYRLQNYLTLTDTDAFDAALLIYGDYCPLSPEQRGELLRRVRRALKPGGAFVFDVSTPFHRRKYGVRNGWYAAQSGFWKPTPHLVLEEGFDYPEEMVYLDQMTVIQSDGTLSVYRNWFQDYDAPSITAELANSGYAVRGLWGDLTGAPLEGGSEWIGVIAEPQQD